MLLLMVTSAGVKDTFSAYAKPHKLTPRAKDKAGHSTWVCTSLPNTMGTSAMWHCDVCMPATTSGTASRVANDASEQSGTHSGVGAEGGQAELLPDPRGRQDVLVPVRERRLPALRGLLMPTKASGKDERGQLNLTSAAKTSEEQRNR